MAFRTERSFRIQTVVALLVICALIIFPLSSFERATLVVAVALVIVLELLNSTVERMVDLFKPRLHEYVGDIKDLMAAAVLAASIFAAFIGVIILWAPVKEALSRL